LAVTISAAGVVKAEDLKVNDGAEAWEKVTTVDAGEDITADSKATVVLVKDALVTAMNASAVTETTALATTFFEQLP